MTPPAPPRRDVGESLEIWFVIVRQELLETVQQPVVVGPLKEENAQPQVIRHQHHLDQLQKPVEHRYQPLRRA